MGGVSRTHLFYFKEKMQRVNIHLSDSQIEELNIISDRTGVIRAELIRRSIDQYIEFMNSRYNIGLTGIHKNIEVR